MAAERKSNVGAWVQLCLSVLLVLIPTLIFPVCQAQVELASGKFAPMRCHYLEMSAVAVSAVMVLNSLIRLLLKGEDQMGLKIVQLACAIVIILLPTALIGACMNATMPCRAGTVPGLLVAGGLTAACALADLVIGLIRAKK